MHQRKCPYQRGVGVHALVGRRAGAHTPFPVQVNAMGREEDEERPPITQQESSLGISQALRRPDNRVEKNSFRTSLRDDTVPEAGEDDNILKWARFYLSLYYNKVRSA